MIDAHERTDLLFDKIAWAGFGRPARPSAEAIIQLAAAKYRISNEQMKGRSRVAYLVRCRALAVHTIRALRPDFSYPMIGRMLGGRDHSTIINLQRKASILIERDADFTTQCHQLSEHFTMGVLAWK